MYRRVHTNNLRRDFSLYGGTNKIWFYKCAVLENIETFLNLYFTVFFFFFYPKGYIIFRSNVP